MIKADWSSQWKGILIFTFVGLWLGLWRDVIHMWKIILNPPEVQ